MSVPGRARYKIERWSAGEMCVCQRKENFMKFLSFARIVLIDCGRVSKRTKGGPYGLLTEGGSPPLNRYN